METEKRRSFIINFTYFLLIAAIALALVKVALPLLMPFVLGFCFAYILKRPIRCLNGLFKRRSKLPAILAVVVFYGTIGVLLTVLILRAFSGIQSFITTLPTLYTTRIGPALTDAFAAIQRFILDLGLFQLDQSIITLISSWGDQILKSLGEMVSNLSFSAMGLVSGIATSLPGLFIEVILMIISTFFIAADYDMLTGFCMRRLSGRAKAIFLDVKEYVIGTLFVCIRSYALIMCITFVELSIGLTLLGLNHAILIAAMIAVFDILPVLGTGGIMIPWTLVSLLTGRYSMALSLFVIYLVITVIRNIIEPKIVGKQLGLHPVVTLASMFAGVQLLGVVGLFGFPIGLSLLRYLHDNGTIQLFKASQEEPPPSPAVDGNR